MHPATALGNLPATKPQVEVVVNLRDFRVGEDFWCGDRQWRCTDIGSRVIVAICVDQVKIAGTTPAKSLMLTKAEAEAEGWFNGPPYALAECVFDEYDQEVCAAAL